MQAVLPEMRRRGRGKIVNVSSLSGRIVAPMLSHYAATKFALEALERGPAVRGRCARCAGVPRRARDVRQRLADVEPRRRRRRRRWTVRGVGRRAPRRLPAARRHPSRRGERRRRPRRHRRPRPTVADALAGGLRGDARRRDPGQPLRRGVGLAAAQRGARVRGADRCTPSRPAPAEHDWSTGNVVLVTGASRGFGAEAARELARRGNTVIATMRTPERDAPAVVAGFEDRIHPVRLDVTIPAEVTAVVAEAVARHGRIDALVNNAGYGLWGPIEALDEDELRRQFDTNFVGQWRMVHAVAPHLRAQRWGKIINVSSLSGRVPSPMLAPYAASKHAVEALTEGLREELVAWGVTATALEPGMYASDWQTAGLDVCEDDPHRPLAVHHGRPAAPSTASDASPPPAPAPTPSRRRSPTSSSCSNHRRCAGRWARTACGCCATGPASPTRSGSARCGPRAGASPPTTSPTHHPDEAWTAARPTVTRDRRWVRSVRGRCRPGRRTRGTTSRAAGGPERDRARCPTDPACAPPHRGPLSPGRRS